MRMENGTLEPQELSDKCIAQHLQQLQSEWQNPLMWGLKISEFTIVLSMSIYGKD